MMTTNDVRTIGTDFMAAQLHGALQRLLELAEKQQETINTLALAVRDLQQRVTALEAQQEATTTE